MANALGLKGLSLSLGRMRYGSLLSLCSLCISLFAFVHPIAPSSQSIYSVNSPQSLFIHPFQAFPITDFPRHLCDILGDVASRNSNLYTDLILTPAHESDSSASHNASQSAPGSDPSLASIFKTLPRSSHANVFKDILSGVRIHSLKPRLDALRLIKSPSEISLLRRAGQVTGRSLNNLLKNLGPLSENFTTPIPESLIQSTLYHASSLQLADPYAYVPVIAGGDRGLTLHYTQNNRLVHPGQGMLLDYGAEFKSYPADVTRTFVLSKKFPTPFREIYDLVLTVQRDIIKLCIPGTTLDALHNESFSRLRRGLTSLFGRRVSEADLRRYYPHHVGHYLGMDIHDTETISKRTIFKAGMVITVGMSSLLSQSPPVSITNHSSFLYFILCWDLEPGLYLPPHTTIPTKYHNVAVRIEDTILVTEAGPVILSVEGVKEVVDIENLIS